jgi:hypothetical protein
MYFSSVMPFKQGTNPSTLSYNASIVKIYSATNGMALFYNKKYPM